MFYYLKDIVKIVDNGGITMKKAILIMTILLVSFNAKGEKKLEIMSTIFPTYDFVRIIGGDKVESIMLLPWGVEPHSYEPSPRDVVRMNNADLLIYTHQEMEPWVKKITKNIKVKNIELANELGLTLDEKEHKHHDHHEHKGFFAKIIDFFRGKKEHKQHEEHHHNSHHESHGHHHEHGDSCSCGHSHDNDPHIWTDPIMVLDIIDIITSQLIALDPSNKNYFQENSNNYKREIQNLHESYLDLVENSKRNKVVFTGHSVFGYFSERYNVEFISPYRHFAPNSEPSPRDVALLRSYIEDNNVKYIYYEELVSPKIANALEKELKVKALLLHGAHNLSKEEVENGVTYLKIMKNNIENLKLGLDYGK